MSWKTLGEMNPELQQKGLRLLVRDGIAFAFLSTVGAAGQARISPVSPIFCDDDMYLSIGDHTPKARDLKIRKTYALHALLGTHDEEFQISGKVNLIVSRAERENVHEAIKFPAYNRDDPVFRLDVTRCLWSYWESPAEKPSKRVVWRAPM